MTRTRKAFEEKIANAVKYAHTVRGVGQKCSTDSILKLFKLSSSYSKLFTAITGKEDNIESLYKEIVDKAREMNRNFAKKTSATPVANIFDLMPETSQTEKPKPCKQYSQKEIEKEVDINRLRDRIRQEIYDELDDRDKEFQKARRESIARRNLEILLAARPKEDAIILATRAVKIADAFIYAINAE